MDKDTRERDDQESDENVETWAHDQQKHSYYYDDAHGYEVYNPDDDENDDEDLTHENTRNNTR